MAEQIQTLWNQKFNMLNENIKTISEKIARLNKTVEDFILRVEVKLQNHDFRIGALEKDHADSKKRKADLTLRFIDKLIWAVCAFAIGIVIDHIHILKSIF